MPLPPEPSRNFQDPRILADFQSGCYPLCGGLPAPPPETADVHERRCLEFLASYYLVNLAIRAAAEPSPERMAALRSAVSSLEDVEDRYASIGFFGEPVMSGPYYADIHFSRPGLAVGARPASLWSSHTAVPGLEDIPLSELTGLATTVRWSAETIFPET